MSQHAKPPKRPFEPPEIIVYGSLVSRTRTKCPQGAGGKCEQRPCDNWPVGNCGTSTRPSAKKTQ